MKTEELIQQLNLCIASMQDTSPVGVVVQASSIRKDDPLIDLLQEAVVQLQDYVGLDEEYGSLINAVQDRSF